MESDTNLAADPAAEETRELEQTESGDPETEASGEEPEKSETNEHDIPPVLDNPEPDIVDRIVIVEVVKEDKKDAAEDFLETETQPESDEETESDTDTASDDAASDFDSDQTGSESETETETQSVMLLNIDSDINTSCLQSIDLKLTCIIFILLFTVCERKLRYGVRALCGRIKND